MTGEPRGSLLGTVNGRSGRPSTVGAAHCGSGNRGRYAPATSCLVAVWDKSCAALTRRVACWCFPERQRKESCLTEVQRITSKLTPRQAEVLQLFGEGLSTAAIASRLGVAVEPARNHIRAVLRGLGVHSRLEAVSESLERGLLDK